MAEESLVGKWAMCAKGRIGKIEGRKELPWGLSWVGVGLDGTAWASREPRLVAESEYRNLEAAKVFLPREPRYGFSP